MTRVVLSKEAREDLKGIENYIAARSSSAARQVIRKLRAAMESLPDMPGKGRLREDLVDGHATQADRCGVPPGHVTVTGVRV